MLTDRNGPFLVEYLPAEGLAQAKLLSTNGTGNGYERLIELKRIAILLSALPTRRDCLGYSMTLNECRGNATAGRASENGDSLT
jgi:hypothetical protein